MNVRFHLVVLSALVMAVGAAGCDSGPSAPKGQALQGSEPVATAAATEASTPTPQPSQFEAVADLKNVHFDLDQSKIRPGDTPLLTENARWLRSRKEMVVQVDGHADERGSDDYNARLGQRRADAVRKYLIAQGIEADRIMTMSQGEQSPICSEHTEACWAKNRRAEFQVKPR
jgi:peptidoglycan-associated lipoprotein